MLNKIMHLYHLPTPPFWRNFGNALMGVSAFAGGIFLTYNLHVAAEIALYTGIAGKLITELATYKSN